MKNARQTLTAIGWRYTIFGVFFLVFPQIVIALLTHFAPAWTNKNYVYVALGLTALTVDFLGFPMVYLLTKNVPKAQIEKKRLGFWKFMLCILIMAGLVIIGVMVGLPYHLILTTPFSEAAGDVIGLTELMQGSNIFVRALVVGILAPIFEELLFRKLMVDRLAPKGEVVAIVTSGVTFGLFHGNFQQGFMAALIGMFFAYVYIRTGRVIYTIGFHMALNLTTSVITTTLIMKAEKGLTLAQSGNSTALQNLLTNSPKDFWALILAEAWTLFLMFIAFAGIVALIVSIILIKSKKQKIFRPVPGAENFDAQALAMVSSWGLWLFYIVCLVKFAETYLPPIIKTITKM